MFPLFNLGVGGKLGSGKQYWSWVSLRDEVNALAFCLTNESVSGAVNITGPTPHTNAEVTKVMGKVMGRPTLLPVPAIALNIALGEFSSEVLGSTRVLPRVLETCGFTWQDPTIEDAIRTAWQTR
jgi:NAD dependent epimerase/dehydratase family enzyme